MRLGLVSFALVVTLVSIPSFLMGNRKNGQSDLSLRQRIDSEIANLQKNIGKAHDLPSRLRAIAKTENEIISLRKKHARQTESDEIFFDQMLAALAEIPREGKFQSASCGDYKSSLIAKLEPAATSAALSPALKKGLRILEGLCGKNQ